MYVDKTYSASDYPFPDLELIPRKEKDQPKFNREMCQAIYSTHISNRSGIPYQQGQYYKNLRLYGAGRQPEDYYKEFMDGSTSNAVGGSLRSEVDSWLPSNRKAQRKGWMNVDWTIVSFMPKIKDMLLPIVRNIDYDLKADAIDPTSGSEEEDRMMAIRARMYFGPILDQLALRHGLPVVPDEIKASGEEDLQRIRAEGGFKASHAVQIEELLKFTEEISQWDEKLYDKLINDVVDMSVCAAREVYDYETKSSMWKYCDPTDTIIQHSRENDFDDADWWGVVTDYPISRLRQIFPEVAESEWAAIAKTYKGYAGNPTPSNWDNYISNDSGIGYVYSNYRVPVMEAGWVDVENKKKIKYTTKKGDDKYYDVDDSKSLKKLSKRESVINHRKRLAWEAKWVVGTKYVFDYGMSPNQPRNNENTRPLCPLKVYRFPYKSITERLKPIMDQVQIAWLKYQNAMSIAFPGGIAIDIGMINNITDGNKKVPFMDVIKMMFERGVLPYKLSAAGKYEGGATVPVQNLPSEVVQKMQEYLTAISSCVKMVEDLTGLNPVALGATPGNDQAVGTTEMSYNAAMKSLQRTVDACRYIKQGLGQYTAERLRILFHSDSITRKNYESIIGKDGVEIIMEAKKRNAKYGIKLEARPTEQDRRLIMQEAEQAFQQKQTGQPGIDLGQKTEILLMINSGVNLRALANRMRAWIEQDKKRLQRDKERVMRIQGEEQRKTQQMMAQQQVQLGQQQVQNGIMVDNNKSRNEQQQILLKEEEQRKTERMKKNLELKNSIYQQQQEDVANEQRKA